MRPNPELTRALNVIRDAGLTVADSLDPARERDYLQLTDMGFKRLAILREHARSLLPTEPPRTTKQRQRDFRAARLAEGLCEVRGIWARPEDAALIRDYARRLSNKDA